MVDTDDKKLPKFANWVSHIKFNYFLGNGDKLSGCFNLSSTADTEVGLRCFGHMEMTYLTYEKQRIDFKVFRNGTLFYASVLNDDIEEDMDILTSYNEFLGYSIFHQKKVGLKEKKHYYFSEITEYATEPGYKRLIARDVDYIGEEVKTNSYDNNKYEIDKNKDYKEELMENIDLVKTVDTEIFDKIKGLCESFKIGDTLILKNLVSACFDSFTDEEFEAIFSFKRDRSFYQDGANSLVDSYFELKNIDKNDKVKKLIKDTTEEWF
jgi:hypothetical protein